MDNLPKLAKDAFVAAQQISFRMKDRTAYRIILKFEQKAQKLTSTHALEILISQTLTRYGGHLNLTIKISRPF